MCLLSYFLIIKLPLFQMIETTHGNFNAKVTVFICAVKMNLYIFWFGLDADIIILILMELILDDFVNI